MIYLFSYKAYVTTFHYFSGNYVVTVSDDNDAIKFWTHIDGYIQNNTMPFEYEIPELRLLDITNNLSMLKKHLNDIIEEKIFNNILIDVEKYTTVFLLYLFSRNNNGRIEHYFHDKNSGALHVTHIGDYGYEYYRIPKELIFLKMSIKKSILYRKEQIIFEEL